MPTQVRLKKAPSTGSGPNWELTEDALPTLGDGQIRLQLHYISIDPGMMGWITAKRSYMEAIHEGDVMRAFGVGEVVESRSQHFPVGSFATGYFGMSDIGAPKQGETVVVSSLLPRRH